MNNSRYGQLAYTSFDKPGSAGGLVGKTCFQNGLIFRSKGSLLRETLTLVRIP